MTYSRNAGGWVIYVGPREVKAAGQLRRLDAIRDELYAELAMGGGGVDTGFQLVELLAPLEIQRTLLELWSQRRGELQLLDRDFLKFVLKDTIQNP
jgi:hypothetical protein